MNSACGYLDLAFFSEYVGDVPVRPATTAEIQDEFAVWLQSRARRFIGQRVQNGSGFGVHGRLQYLLSLYLKGTEQLLDIYLMNTWR
jgi:hypothetical protein